MINGPFEAYKLVRVGDDRPRQPRRRHGPGWADIPGSVVVAVCDIRADRATRVADDLESRGKTRPEEYGGAGARSQQMLTREELDLVYIATPWEFHYHQARAALLAGAHVAVELPIATELNELWDLVNTSEQTRKHLLLAENCSYGRNELAMLKMAHEGVFGDVTNGHGGYLHDLRALLFEDGYYTDDWRRLWHTRSTASFYPMHGLAPIAAAMDINRGDRAARWPPPPPRRGGWPTTASASSPATTGRGRRSTSTATSSAARSPPPAAHHPRRARRERTPPLQPHQHARGQPRHLRGLRRRRPHRCPRLRRAVPRRRHLAGLRRCAKEFDHWLWKELEDDAAGGGHGGMDYILQWRTIQPMRAGLVPDIDVYDSAMWCSPVPLSVESLAKRRQAGRDPRLHPRRLAQAPARPRLAPDRHAAGPLIGRRSPDPSALAPPLRLRSQRHHDGSVRSEPWRGPRVGRRGRPRPRRRRPQPRRPR